MFANFLLIASVDVESAGLAGARGPNKNNTSIALLWKIIFTSLLKAAG